MANFASWVGRLASLKEGEGRLLDNLMLVYGAGLTDGNRHLHDDLPTVIVGRGGGSLSRVAGSCSGGKRRSRIFISRSWTAWASTPTASATLPDGCPVWTRCRRSMQARGATLAPGIFFDSDMGRDFDAAGACPCCADLAAADSSPSECSHSNLDAAAFCDVVARFYGTGGESADRHARKTARNSKTRRCSRLRWRLRNEEGQPCFAAHPQDHRHRGSRPSSFATRFLTQQDMQGIAVLAGPATNLARMLDLSGARSIIASKVRTLVMSAARSAELRWTRVSGRMSPPQESFSRTGQLQSLRWAESRARQRLFRKAPGVGLRLRIPNHPVVAAYRVYREKESRSIGSGRPRRSLCVECDRGVFQAVANRND